MSLWGMVKHGERKTHISVLAVGLLEAFVMGSGCQCFGEDPALTVFQLCSCKVVVSLLMLLQKTAPLLATAFRDLY